MNRRQFLTSALGITGASMLTSRTGLATMASESERNLIFVFAQGGWDPTRVFAAEFNNAAVAMESDADLNQVGDLTWVSHIARPSVDAFFESHYEDTLIINGVQVRSIAHEICTSLLFTGGVSGDSADWATRIASETQRSLAIPHLVLGGPSFSGDLGAMVVRTGASNQLEDVLSRSILERSNEDVPTLSTPSQDVLDQYIQQRVHAKANQAHYGADLKLSQAYRTAMDNAMALNNRRHTMTFTSGSLSNQLSCAVDALAKGVSRCASVVRPGCRDPRPGCTGVGHGAGRRQTTARRIVAVARPAATQDRVHPAPLDGARRGEPRYRSRSTRDRAGRRRAARGCCGSGRGSGS